MRNPHSDSNDKTDRVSNAPTHRSTNSYPSPNKYTTSNNSPPNGNTNTYGYYYHATVITNIVLSVQLDKTRKNPVQ